MLEYATQAIKEIEESMTTPSAAAVLQRLRERLGLDDFGELMISLPLAQFPMVSRVLPRMAHPDVQAEWTGSTGLPLLRQSLSFVRSAAHNFSRLTGRTLGGVPMLDYGCGYGRLVRLMYYFTNPEDLIGVDPWDRSIEMCREYGLAGTFLLSDYLPASLPVARQDFQLIFAFSVFTHLSKRAAKAALDVCRRYIADDGVMIITIRPVEYWDLDASVHALRDTSHMRAAHRNDGFAFSPLQMPPVDGELIFGNTSMTFQWLEDNFPAWKVSGIDRSIDDAYQIYVFLRPR